jgi:putative transposase
MRPRRIEYPGAIYHVMQRGNNKEIIFRNDSDKQFFTAELVITKRMFDFELYGYVLLDNHYHLLLKTNDIPLNKIMQRQNSLYSRYYNCSYDRCGHLFGLRYKALIVTDESYLFALLRYIHWNPIRAGLSETVSAYRWSSDYYYRNNKAGLVDINFILNSISESRKQALNEYLSLIDEEAKMVSDKIGNEKMSPLEDILYKICPEEDAFKLIKAGSRKRELKSLKKKFVSEAINEGFKMREIADFINVSITAIHKLAIDNEQSSAIS